MVQTSYTRRSYAYRTGTATDVHRGRNNRLDSAVAVDAP